MDYDENKIDDVILALMYLTLHDEVRAWKGFDFEALNRLHGKGFIRDPRNKTKSVVLTKEGLARSKALFEEYFGRRS
ncbi:MAG: DUF6429 family protein [Candidatus Binatia bacterium]